MHGRTALLLAIVTGAAAVTLVSLDLAWNLTADLETMRDGEWVPLASAGEDGFYDEAYRMPPGPGSGCGTQQLRVTAHNDAPFARTLDAWASVWIPGVDRGGTERVLWRETWHLDGFASKTKEFTVPSDAFSPPPDTEFPVAASTQVSVAIGDLFLSACIEEGA